MTAISNNIGKWLELNGVGELAPAGVVSPATATIFVEDRPDEPDAQITVEEAPGPANEYVQDSVLPAFRNPGVMVRIRGEANDQAGVRAKAEEVLEVIERLSNQVVDDGLGGPAKKILRATQLGSGINNLGKDNRLRRTYTINFILKVTDC